MLERSLEVVLDYRDWTPQEQVIQVRIITNKSPKKASSSEPAASGRASKAGPGNSVTDSDFPKCQRWLKTAAGTSYRELVWRPWVNILPEISEKYQITGVLNRK